MLGGSKDSHVAEVGGNGGEAAVWFRPGRDHDDETVALQGSEQLQWPGSPLPLLDLVGGEGVARSGSGDGGS